MNDRKWQREPDWIIVERGVVQLATTTIFVRYMILQGAPWFVVERDGARFGQSPNLSGAKAHALHIANELLLIGLEP